MSRSGVRLCNVWSHCDKLYIMSSEKTISIISGRRGSPVVFTGMLPAKTAPALGSMQPSFMT